MNSDHQSHATATIRPLLPTDAEERVKRLVKHTNAVVREQIRSETGLRMVDPDGAARAGAPVSVVAFSLAFAELVAENPNPLLWALVSGLDAEWIEEIKNTTTKLKRSQNLF